MIALRRETGHCTILCLRLAVITINILSDLQADLANPVQLMPIFRRLHLARMRAQAVLEDIGREAIRIKINKIDSVVELFGYDTSM